ncbi:polysaccharide deacetylase [Arthrobacter sp. MYb222]|uniref:polysaccharide deacetylase family protein n=1 Tax=Arthrobacter sp. MYb222 TaxID=1848599 RepID=UPI000CFA9644|nr:polysaccharide deacetylase [Arthrobacter sp. MYb222]PQZ87811.1 polysaccharide deacetylase [Arthrobacter sp. MYb222]
MKNPRLVISLGLALGLAGCSAAQEPPTPAPDPAAVEKAEQEEARVDGVRAEINRLADGYDYDAAIKLAKNDSAEQLNQMASGLEEEEGQVSAWKEPNNIPHLFFHSLIVDPGRAFDEGSSSQGYADYMVTQKEFAAILDELYARDYVLVNPEDFASLDGQGQMEYRDIMLPQGKKPVVLSIDDLSYYEYMEGDGFASKLVLDKDGKVRNEYVDAEGKTQVGAFDVTTMVDDFVTEHPDFTYRDARGLIAMTGYNGAFGYRTSASQYPQSKTLEADQKKAAEIAEAMKNSGWVFASHSWGHIATGTVSMDRLKRDTKLWKAEVEPIVGKTGHYIYPFGSDIARTQRYAGDRYQFFKDQGFDYFYGVDGTTRTWMQQGDEYQRQMRINVDGLQFAKELRGDRPVLGSFFKVEDVIDPARE